MVSGIIRLSDCRYFFTLKTLQDYICMYRGETLCVSSSLGAEKKYLLCNCTRVHLGIEEIDLLVLQELLSDWSVIW